MSQNHREVIDNMAKQLWEMRHTDSFYGIDNFFFWSFLQSYYEQALPSVVEWFNFLWDNQTTKIECYGDIDYHINKLHECVIEEPPFMNMKDVITKKVMYVRNNPGGGEWIFILENIQTIDEKSSIPMTTLKFSVDLLPSKNVDVNPHIKEYAKDDCDSKFDRCCINGENLFNRRWCVERIKSNIFQFNRAAFTLGAAAKGLAENDKSFN